MSSAHLKSDLILKVRIEFRNSTLHKPAIINGTFNEIIYKYRNNIKAIAKTSLPRNYV